MDLDLSVYSELFLPGNHRRSGQCGIERATVNTISSFRRLPVGLENSTSVSGRLVRGNLTFYDNNILSQTDSCSSTFRETTTAWAAWEVDENGKETKMDTEARKEESIQDSKDAIAEYNDNDWYLAYVSINDIVDYRDFIEWFQKLSDDKELEWGDLWCAVHTEDADGYCVEPNIGFCPHAVGDEHEAGTERNIRICRFWIIQISSHDVQRRHDEETMQTHFISMLSYIQDYDDILSMMGQTTDSPNRYQDMINYVKKNGLKIHGFAVSAKKKALLELYKEDVVSYIQTTPQN